MQRVKLTFDRNQDSLTEEYLIYRALGDGESELAMSVAQPAGTNPVAISNEVPRLVNGHYYTGHTHLLLDMGYSVKVDGAPVEEVWLDPASGHIQFATPPAPGSLVTVSYWFDGVEVVDTDTAQAGVTRFAPAAVDRTPPLPVQNLQLAASPETAEVVLSWEPPPPAAGTAYRYRIVAADAAGNRSLPSAEVMAVLNQSLGRTPYVVERSEDGSSFVTVGETAELAWREGVSFSTPPDPPGNLAALFEPSAGEEPAAVVLSWEPATGAGELSAVYRVRTRSDLDAYSDPTPPVGPVVVEQKIAHYVVERYSGEQLELTTTVTGETYRDATVGVPAVYTYRVSAVDVSGQQGGAASTTIDTGNPGG